MVIIPRDRKNKQMTDEMKYMIRLYDLRTYAAGKHHKQDEEALIWAITQLEHHQHPDQQKGEII